MARRPVWKQEASLGAGERWGNLGYGGSAGLEGSGWSQKVPVTLTQQDLGMHRMWAEWRRHFKICSRFLGALSAQLSVNPIW